MTPNEGKSVICFTEGDLVHNRTGRIGRVVPNEQVAVWHGQYPLSYYPPDVLTKFDDPPQFAVCRHCDEDITLVKFGPPSSHHWTHVGTNLPDCRRSQAAPLVAP